MTRGIPIRILLIEDDADLLGGLSRELAERDRGLGEFRVSCIRAAQDAESALDMLKGWRPDIALVDNLLPGMTGTDFVKKLRELDIHIPVLIMSSELTEERHAVRALNTGANEFVRKPFGFQELRAKLVAHLREYMNSEFVILRIGDYEFLPGQLRLVSGEGRSEHITSREAKILKFLYMAKGETVDRGELLRQVWNYSPNVHTHTLETHIYRLRQKIEANPRDTRHIKTSNGGYRLEV